MTIFGITGKTDLLGSFSLHVLYARILADYYGFKLNFNCYTNLNDFHDSGAKDYYLSNKNDQEKHFLYRKTISDALVTTHEQPTVDIGHTSLIEQNILKFGFTEALKKTQNGIREDILRKLPHQNYIDTTNLIVIHFRSSEVIYMEGRYIHSSKYADLINSFRKNMPEKEIVVFTGSKPPITHDDFSAFDGLKIYYENDVTSPNVLEIWRIFIEADILVTARSGFSYTPALLRRPDQTTYAAKFWHTCPDYWNIWYAE